jgi:uncharacterized protein YeaO (DUF488 family)
MIRLKRVYDQPSRTDGLRARDAEHNHAVVRNKVLDRR